MPTTLYSDHIAQYQRSLQKSPKPVPKRPIEKIDNILEIICGVVLAGVILILSLYA